jgi:hypothetical protein
MKNLVFILIPTILILLISTTLKADEELSLLDDDDYKEVRNEEIQEIFDYENPESEEVIIIQAVSTSKKTFVIRKGMKDGLSVGDRSLFSTKTESIVAQVVELNGEFSVWKPVGRYAYAPFAPKQFVNYSRTVESIWLKISKVNELINVKTLEELAESASLKKNKYGFKVNFSKSLSDSITQTDGAQVTSRNGVHFELLRNWKLTYPFMASLGLRYDQESEVIESPSIIITSRRYIGFGEVSYKFLASHKNPSKYYYLGLSGGLGYIQTNILDKTTTGYVALFPGLKLGRNAPINADYNYLMELGTESLFSREKFDDNQVQTYNIINIKLSFGLTF